MSEFVVITGLSGAGRTTTANTFEDLGWYVIDNLPPALLPQVADLAAHQPQSGGPDTSRVALVAGKSVYGDELLAAIEQLRALGERVRILFLEATDDVLVRRFESNRRRHPLASERVSGSIAAERSLLDPVKMAADVVVDTSDLNVHQLRDRLVDLFARPHEVAAGLTLTVMSFGYKYGLPLDADLVLDCRFLPNPHWVDDLRPLTGLDEPVRAFVLAQPETGQFLDQLDALFALLLPAFFKEGKAYLTIGLGCTGGRHRSVVIAEELAARIANHGLDPSVSHRDVKR